MREQLAAAVRRMKEEDQKIKIKDQRSKKIKKSKEEDQKVVFAGRTGCEEQLGAALVRRSRSELSVRASVHSAKHHCNSDFCKGKERKKVSRQHKSSPDQEISEKSERATIHSAKTVSSCPE